MLGNSIKELSGYFETLTSEPTFIPKLFYDSIKIYNGNLYVFDFLTSTWINTISVGNMIESSGTTLPDATTNSGRYYYLTTTDTLYRSNGTSWIAIN
jgi:hypothetical protein